MLRRTWIMPATIAIACAVAVACSGGSNNNVAQNQPKDTGAAAATTTASAGETTTPMTDASTLAVMHEANQAEIGAAQLALKKATAASVKGFAHTMIRDHRAMDAQGEKVSKALNITPVAATNDTLSEHAQHETAQLDSAKGAAFDLEYMTDQVADHQTVLALLQQAQTAPGLNPQIKTLVDSAVTKVQAHLDLAQKVQQGLKPTA